MMKNNQFQLKILTDFIIDTYKKKKNEVKE